MIFIMFKLHLLQSTSRVALRRGITELPYWCSTHTALIDYHILMHLMEWNNYKSISLMNLIHVGFQNLRLTLLRNLICILVPSKYSSILIYAVAIHYFQIGPASLQTSKPCLLWQHIWKHYLIPFPHFVFQQLPAWILAIQCYGTQNAVYYH
jgi:hypothetical protein